MEFPISILLKSNNNNKFLRYREEEGPNHAFLHFSEEEGEKKNAGAEIQFLKFEVEEAKSVQGLVHIRSCYNHKYWVRKSANSKWIVAEANEPDEDQSKSSCTLFKLIPLDSDELVAGNKPQKIRLMHVDHLGQHFTFTSNNTDDDHASELAVDDEDSDNGNAFTMYNVTSTAILPEFVVFQGQNGSYCATTTINGVQYMELNTTDIGKEGVSHRIVQSFWPPGFNIRNTFAQNNWMLDSPYIVTSVRDWSNVLNMYTTFSLVDIGSNFIAIRCDMNNNFVHSTSGLGREHLLSASTTTTNDQAMFRVSEPVRLRVINNLMFNLSDSRIYNVSTVSKYIDTRSNYTSVEQTGSFSVSYSTSRTKSWNDSVSVTTGISASWSSGVPYVGNFGIEVSVERSEGREWGVEEAEEETVAYVQNVTIPPMKKVSLVIAATRALCDVPFTCEVRDTMTDGTVRTYTKRDGLFVGSNEYNFVTQMTEDDL